MASITQSHYSTSIFNSMIYWESFNSFSTYSPTYQLRNTIFNHFEFNKQVNINENNEVNDFLEYKKEKEQKQTVSEIISVDNNIILVLYSSGLCLSLHLRTLKIRVMNTKKSESILSLIYNTAENSIIFIYNIEENDEIRWGIRILLVSSLLKGKIDQFRILFDENENFPIALKFDDINLRLFSQHSILINGKEEIILKVREMKNWEQIGEINITSSLSVCQSYDWFMVSYQKGRYFQFDIYSTDDLKFIKTIKYEIKVKKSIEFLLPFSDLILVKQRNTPLILINIKNESIKTISHKLLKENSSFLLPIRYKFFVTIRDDITNIWNSSGELINSYSNQKKNPLKMNKKFQSKFQYRCLTENDCISYQIFGKNVIFTELFSGELLGELKAPTQINNNNNKIDRCDHDFDFDYGCDDVSYFDVFEHNVDVNEIYSADSNGNIFIWK